MTIKVECTSCGKVLTAKDSAAGKRAKCTQCGDIIQIPEVYEAEEVGGDDEYGDDDYDDDDSPAQEKRKPCPACGEMIIKGAAKCRFCGEIFDPALKRKAKKNRAPSSSYNNADDTDLSTGEWVIAILCSGIGCIVGIVWMIQGKPKGSKMLGISILMQFFWGAVQVLYKEMNK